MDQFDILEIEKGELTRKRCLNIDKLRENSSKSKEETWPDLTVFGHTTDFLQNGICQLAQESPLAKAVKPPA